ncbi:DNA gyrase inhibitor YacG [Alteraurantiacibacter aquimixticola]|uniref:DNA gyrase inhibitor YacG n=1 Tax=Alteraurantiacibacter aquimixticola TaxID=2489173 RepID=A0A4T3F3B2_9SPHN|nr:DNA gyrase inhibitor YacG [Alteraurantiacibacter aquimixticola]TIX51746.1 DNA gyrase inhibitor YacG [Alteraurantiacibacter aquimixticola]
MNTPKVKACPICKKPRSQEFAPFCSARCKDRDLARWFNDSYTVPGERVNPEDIAQED